jgi:hypothetical protein
LTCCLAVIRLKLEKRWPSLVLTNIPLISVVEIKLEGSFIQVFSEEWLPFLESPSLPLWNDVTIRLGLKQGRREIAFYHVWELLRTDQTGSCILVSLKFILLSQKNYHGVLVRIHICYLRNKRLTERSRYRHNFFFSFIVTFSVLYRLIFARAQKPLKIFLNTQYSIFS